MVNFGEEKVKYPKDFVDFFKNRQIIDEIVTKSGIFKLEHFTPKLNPAEEIHFFIIGKSESIENFKIMIDFQKADYDEIKELTFKLDTIRHELFIKQNKYPKLGLGKNSIVAIPRGFSVPRNFAEAVKTGIKPR